MLDILSPVVAGKKEPLPPPTLCPLCRRQRRLAHRNERVFYHRKCDLTGKQMISVHAPEKTYPVYEQHEWWSDKWDPISYGKEIDFTRPFFEQFKNLLRSVPHANLINEGNENADYCQLTANNRNCYLIVESSNNEDCLYGYWLQKCTDCCDVSFSHESRQCYETDNCYGCERLLWSQNCTNCSDSAFLRDCIACRNCLLCINLRQKEYCIGNEQLTKEEFERRKAELLTGSDSRIKVLKEQFHAFTMSQPHKAAQFVQAEDCTGDYIRESTRCHDCYDAFYAEDCAHAEHVWRNAKNIMDASTAGRDAELMYESINAGINSQRILFCNQTWSGCSDLLYCQSCFSSQHCFGCVGLRHKHYCILNKQYTKEEYETLVSRLINHMRSTGEYGEYFPMSLSVFEYRESVAQEYFPLSGEEEQKEAYLGPPVELPDNIADVLDEITKKILLCEKSSKPYKIIPQELAFYRSMNIPLPHNCPDQRHRDRLALRNPQILWKRDCSNCKKPIQTTYSPERPEIVYCEECYLSTVY